MRKIYVKFEKPRKIEDFLKLFYTNPIEYGHLEQNYHQTYQDKKCTKSQCREGKYRSFDDLYLIVKTYYPSITYGKLFKLLIGLKIEQPYLFNGHESVLYKRIYLGTCDTMKRIAIGTSLRSSKINGSFNYNLNLNLNQQKSKYSWKQLLDKSKMTVAEMHKLYSYDKE